ncbi:MAG TPA: translation initiation factor IF-2 [Patescibacteria group bacterium]|nr:translation initiation factor IF-2 [Patescibacteria group bacterium]
MDAKNKNSSNENLYPPVIAVLGHVDHGKTTLLDSIRKTNIAQREHGGITQKIGASEIEIKHEGKSRKITFIDTPGHEAFSKMRGRGVKAADIALLIVALNDGVKPQTKESIELLKKSKTPFIVVLTKSDLPDVNVEKVKQQFLKEEITLESYGGDVPSIEVSAKSNHNVKELLDLILLIYDVNSEKFTFSEKKELEAIVIESKLDLRAGPKATVVIKNGTIRVREEIWAGKIKAKVRSIVNDKGIQLKEVTVGQAVEILGFEETPEVGEIVTAKFEEKKELVEIPLEIQEQEPHEIQDEMPTFIICADTYGSLEALIESLPKELKIASSKTGDIESSDVLYAKSIGAVILGFNIKIKPDVLKLAETEKVLLRNYSLIYEMIQEVEDLLEGKRLAMLEQVYGRAKVLASFPFEKTKALGITVLEGRIAKGDHVRLMRGEEIIGESHVNSVRIGKDPTSKIEKGEEAGIIISPLLDFTIGDMLICHN